MKILVIHDRVPVAHSICELIKTKLSANADIDVAEDGVSARRQLSMFIYDHVIVDLTIPHIKGRSSATYLVVDELLQELFTLDSFNVPGDVIGITKDVEAHKLVLTSLGPHLMAVISEDNEGNWREYLLDKIKYAERAVRTRQVIAGRYFDRDLLIITALDKEMLPFKDKFELQDHKDYPGVKEFIFKDKSAAVRRGVAFAIGRAGQAPAASETQSLINYFKPKLAIMSGFCGGVKSKVNLGDLMFFESSFDWDYGKWVDEKKMVAGEEQSEAQFYSRPSPISITDNKSYLNIRDFIISDFIKEPKLLKRLKELSDSKLLSPEVHLYPGASGSAVVADQSIINRVRGLNESIRAVDMESYGFYTSCIKTKVVKPDFFCVKSVSDFCNGDKDDAFHSACSELAASAVFELISKYSNF